MPLNQHDDTGDDVYLVLSVSVGLIASHPPALESHSGSVVCGGQAFPRMDFWRTDADMQTGEGGLVINKSHPP